ncbi:hypothetical protein T4D_4046 [Trichinella pseudospiralis]|uniref:Uncharacterized protein n=1 Tax=Trichinella pseudospiralis TaxID=6337 RepID=A0A0V1FB95_TRIPS|nr:hypothetical protein T4D_4046 [Trichinella pseudospiralis]
MNGKDLWIFIKLQLHFFLEFFDDICACSSVSCSLEWKHNQVVKCLQFHHLQREGKPAVLTCLTAVQCYALLMGDSNW